MNQGLRGVGAVEDVDEDIPPPDGRVVGDDDDDDFPSGREVPPAESLHQRAKVLLSMFFLEAAALHSECPLLIFLGQNDLYTRRWAPEVDRGEHNPPGHAQVGCGHLVSPLWYLLAPIFLIYSIKILHKVSSCLELCIIGSLTQLFQVQISSCRILPLCVYLGYYERKGIRMTPKSIIMQ